MSDRVTPPGRSLWVGLLNLTAALFTVAVAPAAQVSERDAAAIKQPLRESEPRKFGNLAPHLILKEEYRNHLERWAGGDSAAIPDYSRFQAHVIERITYARGSEAEGRALALICLGGIESNTLKQLARQDLEALPAAAVFHAELYLDQMVREFQRLLAPNALETHSLALDLYRKQLGQELVPANLAQLYLYTGALLDQTGFLVMREKARSYFRQAIQLQPDYIPALYWAASFDEYFGRNRRAASGFERLIELRPLDGEFRLRATLNRMRLGSIEFAMKALVDLIERDTAEWIALLAIQELARLSMPDNPKTATDVLRRGLERYPTDATLKFQLASYLEPGSAQARGLFRSVLDQWSADPGGSARGVYEEPRLDELEEAGRRFESQILRTSSQILVASLDEIRTWNRYKIKFRTDHACSSYTEN